MSKIRIRKRGKTYSYSFEVSKNPRRMKEKGGYATEDEAFDAGVKAYADWMRSTPQNLSRQIQR